MGVIFLLVFDAVMVFAFAGTVKTIIRGLKYGSVLLRYEQFPMLLGSRAAVRLMLDRPVDAPSVTGTLRFIEEKVEVSRHGRGSNSRRYVFDQLYEEKLGAPLAFGADGRQSARFEFQLPEGDYSTRLSAGEPRDWLFQAEAETPGVDFQARFLLPVDAP